MRKKKRNKQDVPNTVGRKAKIRINCLSDNVIIIKNDGDNVRIKIDAQSKDTSNRRTREKHVERMGIKQMSNATTTKEDAIKKAEQTTKKVWSQKEGNRQETICAKNINPNAIMAEIKRPKKKYKKDKKDTVTGAKATKPVKTNEFRKELHEIFIGYRHMTGKIEKELNRMGFSIKRKRNHIILSLFYNGKTHTFAISVSASDNRCGYKIVSNIMKAINL